MEAVDLQVHPAAQLFPMMQPDELGKLAADIGANGLREAIDVYQGKILDGRNRLAACKIAGVKPDIFDRRCVDRNDTSGFDPVAYVLSKNLHRRHLTDSQRAMVSTEVEKLFAAEAKERQRAAGGDKTALVATVPQAPSKREPSARDKAAAALGVSGRTVTAAKRVAADGAEAVAAAVKDGKLSVSVAEKLVRVVPDKKRQEKIVENGVVSSTVRVNDTRVKRDISAAEYRNDLRKQSPPPDPPPRKRKPPVGVAKGNEAIDVLKGILSTDEQYLRGHQIVADYIRHNFALQPGRYSPQGENAEIDGVENCKRWRTLLAAIRNVQKLAEAMADDGILTDVRLKEADEASGLYLVQDAVATLPAIQLVMEVCCEAGGPLG